MTDISPELNQRLLETRTKSEEQGRSQAEKVLKERGQENLEIVYSYLLKDNSTEGEEKYLVQTAKGNVKEISLDSDKNLVIKDTDIEPWLEYSDPLSHLRISPEVEVKGEQGKVTIKGSASGPIEISGARVKNITISGVVVGGSKKKGSVMIKAKEVTIEGPGEKVNIKSTPQGIEIEPIF